MTQKSTKNSESKKDSVSTSQVEQLIEEAKKQLANLTGFKDPGGVGLRKEGENWVVTVDIVETESIPDGMDIIGTYEVRLDDRGNLLGYERTRMRKRIDTQDFEEE